MGFLGVIRRLFASPRPSGDLAGMGDPRPIRARYDAAQPNGINTQHWAAADAMDVDSAHSLAVRRVLCQRSRYEIANNGHGRGIVLTQANYVVGRGPKLRMQTRSAGFNAMVEAAWNRWAKRVKLARKLRTMIKAKTGDGEGILIARRNPNLRDPVKLDLVGIECEQLSTPFLGPREENAVDGIKFDEFGNPLYYDVLKYHPGAGIAIVRTEVERIPAKFVFHLFREDRPNQHRAVPETTPSLNLFAQGRRWREAVVAAAENIADFSIFLKTQETPDVGPNLVRPLTSFPIDKSMLVSLPFGYDAFQPKAEQPAASHESFNRSIINEEARPLNMPYNIAAADSSGYSFSGGRLDHLTYFVSVDTDQADTEDLVLDPCFELWFEEAVRVYGWAVEPEPAPPHEWDWPAKPQIDDTKTAKARKTNLSTGILSMRRAYAEDGLDFEDELPGMAEDYGVSVDEMRAILLKSNFSQAMQSEADEEDEDPDPPPPPSRNGTASRNGFARTSR
jgi:capsid protein